MTLVSATKNAVIFFWGGGGLASEACYFFGYKENILGVASLSKFMQSAPPGVNVITYKAKIWHQ